MKLSSINSVKSEYNSTKANNNNKVNFKGGVDTLVKFWQIVDSSRALQFTVEDMLGTNLPRTYKGATAGYKYTGKVNIPALLQEATREFLTGPMMCAVPIAVLSCARKNMGKSAGTHIENIRNLSYIAQQTAKENTINQEDFLSAVTKDMLDCTLGDTATKEDYEKLTKEILEYNKLTSQKPNKKAKKQFKKDTQNALNRIQETYSKIIKQRKKEYQGDDFLGVTYTTAKGKTKSSNFKDYVDFATSYSQDIAKKGDNKINAKLIEEFKNSWTGKRALVIVSMIALTGIVMSQIPKWYTKISGNINPNASAIYNEAKGANNKKEGVK